MLETAGPPFDARLDPTGERVAYETGGALHSIEVSSGVDTLLADDPDPDVRWGVAEFIAAEEMERLRGYWWAPDGRRVLACRVDDRPVGVWHIASPIDPAAEPRAVRYPRAGTPNAIVTHARARHRRIACRRRVGPSVVRVRRRRLLDRRRTAARARAIAGSARRAGARRSTPTPGRPRSCGPTTTTDGRISPPGVPAWLPGGRLLTVGHRDDTRTLLIDGEPRVAGRPAGRRRDRGGRRSVVHRDA